MDEGILFRKCLIAELFTPGGGLAPLFILSPAKIDASGTISDTIFADGEYHRIRNQHCIFWQVQGHVCNIYEKKPFGCSLLLCAKMTGSEPVLLRKTFYYNKWIGHQDIIFNIFPGLEKQYLRLCEETDPGAAGVAEITKKLNASSEFHRLHGESVSS